MAITLSDLTLGAKIEIETYSSVGVQNNRVFLSRLDEVDVKAGEIRMLAPIDMLTGHRIHAGEIFNAYVMSAGMLYQLRCRAIGYERSNKTILLVAKLAEKTHIENANRRNEFRVKALIDVAICRIPQTEEGKDDPLQDPSPPIKCITSDISAGGIGIVSRASLHVGEVLKCELSLKKEEIQGTITFKGRVVRIIERDKKDAFPYAAGIKVETISAADSSLLLRYALACQREELRQRSDDKK